MALAWSLLLGGINLSKDGLPHTVEKAFHEHPKALSLSSDGWFGKFDRQQLQRGFQVYQEVCAACHSLKHVAYRDLAALGYSEAEIKAIAAKATITAKDPLTGEVKDRPGLASDKFPPVVYAGQGVPPDLSLITKAREGGKDYVYSLLTGFQNPPANLPKELQPPTGLHYNPYFANLNLAMAPPLTKGQVTFADGSPNTVEAMAKDVTAFLVWTAEPKLVKRVQVGWAAFLFLLIFTTLTYLSYRNIWADKKH